MKTGILPVALLGSKNKELHRSTFIGENGLSLDAYSPVAGNPFVEALGEWVIQGNRARLVSGFGAAITVTPNANVQIEAVVSSGFTTDLVGVLFRFSNASNFWFVRIRHSDSTLKLYEYNGGIYFQRALAYPTILINTDYSILVIVSGQTITVTLDGGYQIRYSLASFNQSESTHGLFASTGGSSYHDDFIISSL